MLKWQKIAVGVVLTLALLVAFGCAKAPAPEVTPEVPTAPEVEKTATIGLLGALTGPLRIVAGATYAIEDYMTYINDKGGIEYADPKTGKTEHFKFKWIMGDHGWDSAKCISLYERFKASGMIWAFTNGSVPSVSVYAMMARDHIPGTPCGCTGEPCFYDIEEPYLHADMAFMPQVDSAISGYFVNHLWEGEGTPKIGIMAANVGSRRVLDLPEAHTYDSVTAMGGELLPIEYVPITPVDMKVVFSRLVDKGANLIQLDHWGEAATRVFIHNAIDLKLWEKGIALIPEWSDNALMLSEPDVWATYEKMGGKLLIMRVGWGGSKAEYDKYASKYPGMKLSFDLCEKYRNKLPEEIYGGQYLSGTKDGMILEMVFKSTLEKYGFEGLTGEHLRDALFSLELIDSGGLFPPFIVNPDQRTTQPHMCLCSLTSDGHQVFDPEVYPWLEAAPVWGLTWNPYKLPAEWAPYVFTNYMEVIP